MNACKHDLDWMSLEFVTLHSPWEVTQSVYSFYVKDDQTWLESVFIWQVPADDTLVNFTSDDKF